MAYQQNKGTYQRKKKNMIFKHYGHNSNNLQILNKLESLQNLFNKLITDSKYNYYSRIANSLNIIW